MTELLRRHKIKRKAFGTGSPHALNFAVIFPGQKICGHSTADGGGHDFYAKVRALQEQACFGKITCK